jgi:hypothetical protein
MPSSRETSNANIQINSDNVLLRIDHWNFSGAWMLEVGVFPQYGPLSPVLVTICFPATG